MRRALTALFLCVCLAITSAVFAKGTKASGGTKSVHVKGYTKKDGTYVEPHTRSAPKTHASKPLPPPPPVTSQTKTTAVAPRDAKGRIERSETAKRDFERKTGYPNGRPGYVVDHIVPLACGGADAPTNMQWQTIAAAKAKDKTERQGCHR